jgi:hypothetical protein
MKNRQDMISIKNNGLAKINVEQLCETHNGKRAHCRKVRLSTSKSRIFAKTFHPLKQKKIKLHKLKFVSESEYYANVIKEEQPTIKNTGNVLSIRYTTAPIKTNKLEKQIWSTEFDIINWLLTIGVKIKRISSQKYFLKDRICFLNNVLVFANRKRIEMGLEPFYLENLTEF